MKPNTWLLIPDEEDVTERKTPETQTPHVSYNGQYEKFDPTQLGDKLAVQNYIVVLAAQNKVYFDGAYVLRLCLGETSSMHWRGKHYVHV